MKEWSKLPLQDVDSVSFLWPVSCAPITMFWGKTGDDLKEIVIGPLISLLVRRGALTYFRFTLG
jgi:hypothetical protein